MKSYKYAIVGWTGDEPDQDFIPPYKRNWSHEMIAEYLAEERFSEDPEVQESEVIVADEDGVVKRFNVTGEPTMNFYAREI